MLTRLIFPAVLASAIALGGCSSTTERTLGGAAIGAGTGAAIGAVTGGSPAPGAILGGAVGAVGGLLYDNEQKRQRRRHHYRY